MMIKTKLLTTLVTALSISSGAAYAAEVDEKTEAKPILNHVQQDSFVSIPLNMSITVIDKPHLEHENSDKFDTDFSNEVKYDLLGNVDANFGLIKSKNVASRYRVKSGALPRGRYFKPVNSKLGAGISSKF